MYLLYCDESNLEERAGDFFVYGGVAIRESEAQSLSDAIGAIRTAFKIDRSFPLKFNPGPVNLSHQQFIDLKQGIVEAAVKHNVGLFLSMILHDIASSPDEARRNEINRICYHFDCVLGINKEIGLVLIDRFSDKQIDAHLVEKFSVGIVGLPFTRERRLENILGFHYSAIGQSHFSSLIDIVLGSFRFAINAFTRNDARLLETARVLIRLLAPLLLRQGDNQSVSELGLFFSPKTIKVERYRNKYAALKEFFAECGVEAEQKINAG
jgi:hypothetical protein